MNPSSPAFVLPDPVGSVLSRLPAYPRFVASHRQDSTDLTISANAQDFLRLAQRQEDPDTLFFNRRLSMEGDTELGLLVKNALDALELPVLNLQQWTPDKVLARFLPKRNRNQTSTAGHGG